MNRFRQFLRSSSVALTQRGFRRDAALLLVLAVTTIVVAMAIITPIVATNIVVSNEIEQGEQIATSFAQGSTAVLLYRSRENGQEPAARALSFPGVEYVAVHDDTGALLRADGAAPTAWRPSSPLATTLKNAAVAHEDGDYWHIISPVRLSETPDNSPFVLTPASTEYLGYVHVVRSKASVKRLRGFLVSSILIVAIGAVLASLLVFIPMMNRLLRPILKLSETLEREVERPTPLRILEEGPREMVKMARSFNKMMAQREQADDRLREHSRLLESEIDKATEELRRARDAAVSASSNKSQFLSLVSHEIRTPLQSIIGYTEMVLTELEKRGLSALVKDLDVVIQACDRLRRLVDNVLDLEKIEIGKMDVAMSAVNLHELGPAIADMIRATALCKSANNRIDVVIGCGRASVTTDQEKLRQITFNLLSNANKFTTNGKITLTMDCSEAEIIVSVSDTGCGIAKEDQEIIFEPFRQVGVETSHSGGTGLGLAIVKRFTRLLGGTVDVQSELNKGSTFTVRLPANGHG